MTAYIKSAPLQDLSALTIDIVDRAFMLFYRHVRRNSRRITRLILALLPLMVLLVGSCKTSELPSTYGNATATEQFRMALFPDRSNLQDAHYSPAAGYVSRARSFVAEVPENLMKLTQQEIGYLFGKPTLQRRDADAEVWQYKTSSCVVDFYFYGKGNAAGQSPVSYTDIRLKDQMIQGGQPRTQPVSVREQSDCLQHVASGEVLNSHA